MFYNINYNGNEHGKKVIIDLGKCHMVIILVNSHILRRNMVLKKCFISIILSI
jgi:hypothetical protein